MTKDELILQIKAPYNYSNLRSTIYNFNITKPSNPESSIPIHDYIILVNLQMQFTDSFTSLCKLLNKYPGYPKSVSWDISQYGKLLDILPIEDLEYLHLKYFV